LTFLLLARGWVYRSSGLRLFDGLWVIFAGSMIKLKKSARSCIPPAKRELAFQYKLQSRQMDILRSPVVKVFGCRPMMTVRRALGAGVRKPPRETAGGVAKLRVRGYGDFGAGGLLATCF
jgi:hypothetical protein